MVFWVSPLGKSASEASVEVAGTPRLCVFDTYFLRGAGWVGALLAPAPASAEPGPGVAGVLPPQSAGWESGGSRPTGMCEGTEGPGV